MAVHQSSVYAGTIAGGARSGVMAQSRGWQSPFWVFGGLGVLLGLVLMKFLREPMRGQSEQNGAAAIAINPQNHGIILTINELLKISPAVFLIVAFMGANFVAVVFLTWMPSFLFTNFT